MPPTTEKKTREKTGIVPSRVSYIRDAVFPYYVFRVYVSQRVGGQARQSPRSIWGVLLCSREKWSKSNEREKGKKWGGLTKEWKGTKEREARRNRRLIVPVVLIVSRPAAAVSNTPPAPLFAPDSRSVVLFDSARLRGSWRTSGWASKHL